MTHPVPRPMFPRHIDSTMLRAFRSCPRKFYQEYILHWKSRYPSVHLIAGGAFASGIEAARKAFYVDKLPVPEAEALGALALLAAYGDFTDYAGSAKTPDRMLSALDYYFQKYPLDAGSVTPIILPDGSHGIELPITEPLETVHPVTGKPIIFTGRLDMVAERSEGIYGYDEKTTTSLGQTWGKQWEMRSQFTGYMWALAKRGIKLQGFIIRGVSILKTTHGTTEVLTDRSQYEIDRWVQQVNRDLERMIHCWETGDWDWNLDAACDEYGGCQFVQICRSPDPDRWLPVQFVQRVWDPLLREETSVAAYEASCGHIRGEGEPKAQELAKSQTGLDNVGQELAQLLGRK